MRRGSRGFGSFDSFGRLREIAIDLRGGVGGGSILFKADIVTFGRGWKTAAGFLLRRQDSRAIVAAGVVNEQRVMRLVFVLRAKTAKTAKTRFGRRRADARLF